MNSPKSTCSASSLLPLKGYGGWHVALSSPSSPGLQLCSASKCRGHHRSQKPQRSGESRRRKAFLVIAVTGKLHPYSLGHRPEGHPWLSPTPKIQSIDNSFWLYLQSTLRILCSHHLHRSHPSPSRPITHLNYVNDILTWSMISLFCPSVHTGASLTAHNSILMQLFGIFAILLCIFKSTLFPPRDYNIHS